MNIGNIICDFEDCLDSHDQQYKHCEVRDTVDRWLDAKGGVIDILRKHPNWNEDALAVVFDYDSQREIDQWKYRGAQTELYRLYSRMSGVSNNDVSKFNIVTDTYAVCHQFVNEDIQAHFREYGIKAAIGTKVSRVLGKYFREIGLDKAEGYNKHYAALSDAINPLKITRFSLLSVHPCDYLNMSNGTGWDSCHSLVDGCHMAGTLSYMGDECTMIFYTVDKSYDGDVRYFWKQPKINRQVYSYQNGLLLQSRLYPNCNDSDNYDSFRNAVQKIMADAMGVPNLWKNVSTWDSLYNNGVRTYGGSLHYADYEYDEYNAKLSILKDSGKSGGITIGSTAYCLSCGDILNDSGELNCCGGCRRCEECGDELDEDDAIEIDGLYYCADCVTRCDECGDYYVNSDDLYTVANGDEVCESCLNVYYTRCSQCGEYYPNGDLTNTADGDSVCDDCIEEYACCNDCGDYYRSDSDDITYDDGECMCADCLESRGESEREIA